MSKLVCMLTEQVLYVMCFYLGYVIYDKHLVSREEFAVALASVSNYHIVHSNAAIANALILEKILIHQKCVDISTATYR